jgi:hypothetical protein
MTSRQQITPQNMDFNDHLLLHASLRCMRRGAACVAALHASLSSARSSCQSSMESSTTDIQVILH